MSDDRSKKELRQEIEDLQAVYDAHVGNGESLRQIYREVFDQRSKFANELRELRAERDALQAQLDSAMVIDHESFDKVIGLPEDAVITKVVATKFSVYVTEKNESYTRQYVKQLEIS